MDELEELREENHRLNLRLESLKSSTTTEVDYLRDELALKDKEHQIAIDKILSEAKTRETQLLERTSTLNDDLNVSREEVERYREQVECLKSSIEHLKLRNNDAVNSRRSLPDNHYDELKERMLEKEKQLNMSNCTIQSQSERLRESKEIIDDLRNRISLMREEVETKQGTIFEQQERMRQMEMERTELIQKDQQKVLDKCDGKSRGNSLFSEVEERRVKVEDELKRLRERVIRLTKENVELQATVEKGDSRHTAVSNQLLLLQKSEEQMIKELRQLKTESLNLFDSYRDRLMSIRDQYVRRLSDYSNSVICGDLERITEERDNLLLSKISLERELFDCKKDLKFTKHTKTECEAHLKILRLKLQEQNDKKANNKETSELPPLPEEIPNGTPPQQTSSSSAVSKNVESLSECKQQ